MKATFGMGCFWCSEDVFIKVKGVRATAVGYMGGNVENPTYEQVCTDRTGHAEVVQVDYDPETVSYDELLKIFFANHDPTTPNRQGPDVGRQYRSAVFFHTPEQESVSREAIERLQPIIGKKIVTEVTPASTFWKAEDYHQKYYVKCGLKMH
ncbi:peptide-methionine (S)-S-oxide reductase MsrA [Nitrososphaera sp.]|uniref:peptide-methionine (S)-S-oxide reductase MsrA n=1 Tax=Nitrososphaera sp. TaxID=1971748 RepID=UPI002EDAFB9B